MLCVSVYDYNLLIVFAATWESRTSAQLMMFFCFPTKRHFEPVSNEKLQKTRSGS